MEKRYDVIVVGSGIGGYPAAVLLAKKGLRVAIVEKDHIGGECVNFGCIPSKALLHYAVVVREARRLGMIISGATPSNAFSFAKDVVEEDRKGIESLLENAGVEVYTGIAVPQKIGDEIVFSVDGVSIASRYAILALGSTPLWPRWASRCERIGDNRDIFSHGLPEGAEKIAIVGAGFIGVELSQAFSSLGINVTVYEAMPDVLPGFDKDLSRIARRALREHGVEVKTKTPVARLECLGDKARLCTQNGTCVDYDYVLMAIGRRPAQTGDYAALGIHVDEKGFIKVNERCETSMRKVYAAGDITGPPLLAHKAIHESLIAAKAILGENVEKPKAIPLVVYGQPELAVVKKPCTHCVPVTVKLYWGYNAMAKIEGYRAQLVFAKIVFDKNSGRLLEAYLAGPNVSEFAAELALAIENDLRIEDIRRTVHPHPSAAEAIWDLVLTALGEAFNKA